MRKKVSVIGCLAMRRELQIGATVKTRYIVKELKQKYGMDNVFTVDTDNWRTNSFHIFFGVFYSVMFCENIILLISLKSFKIMRPVIIFFNNFFKVRLHYIVLGGKFPEGDVDEDFFKSSKLFENIIVETKSIESEVRKLGFENVYVMKNFKSLIAVSEYDLLFDHSPPYKICIFSRIDEKKGISEAIDSVNKINEKYGHVVYYLDIYGRIEEDFNYSFQKILLKHKTAVKYMGIVNPENSVNVLKDYFMLLFPTKYYNEGVPGTIIDAFSSGLPVLSTNWANCSDIIQDNYSGIVVPFGEFGLFTSKLEQISLYPEIVEKLRINCLNEAKLYLPENCINVLCDLLN